MKRHELDGNRPPAADGTQRAEEIARSYGLSFIVDLSPDTLRSDVSSRLPVEWVRTHGLLPVTLAGRPAAALHDPAALNRLNELVLMAGEDLEPVIVTAATFLRAVDATYMKEAAQASDPVSNERMPASNDDLLRAADQAPVTQRVNSLLIDALRKRASDIHLEPFRDHLMIRFRVDGQLYEQPAPPKGMEAALVSRMKIMARLDIAERRLPQDGVASVRIGEQNLDVRVSTLPVAEGERVVLRLLNRESTIRPLADLGMPTSVLQGFRKALSEPNGIILVTGPTGSGKTTTLYAALQEIDTAHLNVMTIEDPVEYRIEGIGQMQVRSKIGLTFAQGLRHILRQDPDVILVGEIRDRETAEIAVRASLTGHLVFATLHTNDAVSAVIRLQDMGVEPYLISAALRGVMAQRLVRRLCERCASQVTFQPRADVTISAIEKACAGRVVGSATGCPECMAGYRGRTGLYEWMAIDDGLRDLIRASASTSVLSQAARQSGLHALADDGIAKILGRVTTTSEVLRALGSAG